MTSGRGTIAGRIAVGLLALALGLGVAACGGDDDDATTTATEQTTTTEDTMTETETTTASGREVFVANCGSCHALSDAGTSGAIGPSLDGLGLDVSAVEAQVRNGGGGMPAFEGELSDDEIQAVSAYVASSS
jgi:mono/diheme cytochrome c family protein